MDHALGTAEAGPAALRRLPAVLDQLGQASGGRVAPVVAVGQLGTDALSGSGVRLGVRVRLGVGVGVGVAVGVGLGVGRVVVGIACKSISFMTVSGDCRFL